MAYLDIPSDIQYLTSSVYPILLPTLDIKDFGLATAGDVSNVVVVLNVYNTATANSWDYEACLINNHQVITANLASNVFHSNTTTSERVFIFNANTFSKHEIESQSFGFRYRPVSDGGVRVYVGNVRVRITNSQPANGITSYVQHRALTEEVTSIPIRKNDISLIKSLSAGITLTITKVIALIKESIAGISSSIVTTILSGVQEVLLVSSVGLSNTHTKSISLIKSLVTQVNGSNAKNVQSIRTSITSIHTNLLKNISAIRNAKVASTTLSIKSIHKNFFLNVQSVIDLIENKMMKLLLSIQIELESGLTKTIDKTMNGFVSLQFNIEKAITAIFSTQSGIRSTVAVISDVIQNIIVPVSRMMLVKTRDLLEKISKRESVHPIKKRDNTENI